MTTKFIEGHIRSFVVLDIFFVYTQILSKFGMKGMKANIIKIKIDLKGDRRSNKSTISYFVKDFVIFFIVLLQNRLTV